MNIVIIYTVMYFLRIKFSCDLKTRTFPTRKKLAYMHQCLGRLHVLVCAARCSPAPSMCELVHGYIFVCA